MVAIVLRHVILQEIAVATVTIQYLRDSENHGVVVTTIAIADCNLKPCNKAMFVYLKDHIKLFYIYIIFFLCLWFWKIYRSGGVLLSEEDKGGMCQQQEQIMLSQPPNADPLVDVVKQESYAYGRNQEFLQAKPTWSQIVPPPPASSSPKSSTTVTSFNSSGSMLDFSNNKTDTRSPPSDPISNSEVDDTYMI